ncbi:MAG: LysM peptidoglycan-binding domain-containing protein [Phycisphaerae bacterium]
MMRRNASILAAVVLISGFQFGCSMMEPDPAMGTDDYDYSSGSYDTSNDGSYVARDDYSTGAGTAGASDSSYDTGAYDSTYDDPYTTNYPSADSTAMDTKYHTVSRKDTLYSLARMYYNDASRWKDIYQANQDAISDPNKIFVGQRLLIP